MNDKAMQELEQYAIMRDFPECTEEEIENWEDIEFFIADEDLDDPEGTQWVCRYFYSEIEDRAKRIINGEVIDDTRIIIFFRNLLDFMYDDRDDSSSRDFIIAASGFIRVFGDKLKVEIYQAAN